jgi:Cu-Zn family superoxide dismutase
VHLHQTGLCEGPSFLSAGPHFNPTKERHGAHLGDFRNLEVKSLPHVAEMFIPGATIDGGGFPLMDANGSALVIHAVPDDYRTDPDGRSGARIACALIVRPSDTAPFS